MVGSVSFQLNVVLKSTEILSPLCLICEVRSSGEFGPRRGRTMAVARAWTGSLCAFVQQQQLPALVISRQCCSCHSSASQPAVSSSSFVPSWTVKSSNRLSAGRRRNSARFSVLASQEAGTSTCKLFTLLPFILPANLHSSGVKS